MVESRHISAHVTSFMEVDFSKTAPGTIVNLVNTAGAPFPAGPTPQTPNGPYTFLANMMQFSVVAKGAPAAFVQPANWATAVQASVTNKIAALAAVPAPPVGPFVGVVPPTNPNTFILNEVTDPNTKAPLRVQIDGKAFEDAVDTTPKRGSVQYWDIVNTTVDAHPMHLHLVQFKVIGRWTLDINKYTKAAITPNALTGGITVNKAINPMQFVMGVMRAPEPGEEGFKDTAKSFPGELLRIVAKWDGGWQDVADPLNPTKPFYQPVTSGPYVWHCHIVDHEDNEMMRPTLVIP